MPLSENEQRILRQIEQQLEKDPTFSTRGYRIPRRRVVNQPRRRLRHRSGGVCPGFAGSCRRAREIAPDRCIRDVAHQVCAR